MLPNPLESPTNQQREDCWVSPWEILGDPVSSATNPRMDPPFFHIDSRR